MINEGDVEHVKIMIEKLIDKKRSGEKLEYNKITITGPVENVTAIYNGLTKKEKELVI